MIPAVRIGKLAEASVCVAVLLVGAGMFAFGFRHARNQFRLVNSSVTVRADRAEFSRWACLERRVDASLPGGALVFDADLGRSKTPGGPDDEYAQRIIEFVSAHHLMVARPSASTWTVAMVPGHECGTVSLHVSRSS